MTVGCLVNGVQFTEVSPKGNCKDKCAASLSSPNDEEAQPEALSLSGSYSFKR